MIYHTMKIIIHAPQDMKSTEYMIKKKKGKKANTIQ